MHHDRIASRILLAGFLLLVGCSTDRPMTGPTVGETRPSVVQFNEDYLDANDSDLVFQPYDGEWEVPEDASGAPRCMAELPSPRSFSNQTAFVNTETVSFLNDFPQYRTFTYRTPWVYFGANTRRVKNGALFCGYKLRNTNTVVAEEGDWEAVQSEPSFIAVKVRYDVDVAGLVRIWGWAPVTTRNFQFRRISPTSPTSPPGITTEPPAGCEWQIIYDPSTCTGNPGGTTGSGETGNTGGTTSQCQREYIIIEVSNDGGATWTVWWEGEALVCN